MPIPATWMKSEVDEQTLHGSELRKTTRDGPKTPVNNGTNYQPQMVREIYEPTTVVGEIWPSQLSIQYLLFTGDKGSYFSQQINWNSAPPHSRIAQIQDTGHIALHFINLCPGNQFFTPIIDTQQQKTRMHCMFQKVLKNTRVKRSVFLLGVGDAGTGAKKIYLATSEKCQETWRLMFALVDISYTQPSGSIQRVPAWCPVQPYHLPMLALMSRQLDTAWLHKFIIDIYYI